MFFIHLLRQFLIEQLSKGSSKVEEAVLEITFLFFFLKQYKYIRSLYSYSAVLDSNSQSNYPLQGRIPVM